jgi:hypothetical protein
MPEKSKTTAPRSRKTFPVNFTESEMRLLYTETNAAIECGAEDPDFETIREKLQKKIRQMEFQ